MAKIDYQINISDDGEVKSDIKKKKKKRKTTSKKRSARKRSSKKRTTKKRKQKYVSPLKNQHTLTYVTVVTEDGLRFVMIKEIISEQGKKIYRVEEQSINWNLIDKQEFETREKARAYFVSKVSDIEVSQKGLTKAIKDLMTRLKLLDTDYMFLFELLIDPKKREDYELAGFEEESETKIIKKKKNKSKKTKKTGKKLKMNQGKKPKLSKNLRKRIRGYDKI